MKPLQNMNRCQLGLGCLGFGCFEFSFDLLDGSVLLLLLGVLVRVIHVDLGQFILELLQRFFVRLEVASISSGLGTFVPPIHALHGSQLDGVPDNPHVLHIHQGMAAHQHHCGLRRGFHNRLALGCLFLRAVRHNPAWDQGIRRQGPRLVEQAVAKLPGQRHTEGLGAKDSHFHQGHQRSVDRHGHLHRQLTWHHSGENNHALEQQLVCCSVPLLQTLHQYIRRRADSKPQQNQQAQSHLLGIRGHLVHGVLNHLQQLPLAGVESRSQHVGQAASLWCLGDVRQTPAFRGILCVDNGGTGEDDVDPVLNVDIQRPVCVAGKFVLHLRHGFSRQGSLTRDCCSSQNYAVHRSHVESLALVGIRLGGLANLSHLHTVLLWRRVHLHQIPGQQLLRADFFPSASSVDLDSEGLAAHVVQGAQGLDLLEN
mmetsp:Transcript_6056/g.13471  ORF Transcript_6056/g.13471 Transcript_6056/m.13471 type:complete len:426 (-) Transcript_6056:614-1891(-)